MEGYVILMIFWLICLGIYLLAIITAILGYITDSEGIEFVNPSVLYSRFKINWFGAYFLAIVFNILDLPLAIAYWFYKLCTVGRK
jgi:hypothetical protein